MAQWAMLHAQLVIEDRPLLEDDIEWLRCHRIITSEHAQENLFDRLVAALPAAERGDASDELREIADLTNPHVASLRTGLELVLPEDRISGRGTGLIMSAFAYPAAPSRFSDGSAGTYLASGHVDTAIEEVRHHATQYLAGSGPCVVEKTRIEASLVGTFLDVRTGRPAPPGIYHSSDYRASQALGAGVRQLRGYGIVYDSVRHKGGECVAVMRPPVLQKAVAVETLRLHWDGSQVTHVR